MGNQLQPSRLEHRALSQRRGRGNEREFLAKAHEPGVGGRVTTSSHGCGADLNPQPESTTSAEPRTRAYTRVKGRP